MNIYEGIRGWLGTEKEAETVTKTVNGKRPVSWGRTRKKNPLQRGN